VWVKITWVSIMTDNKICEHYFHYAELMGVTCLNEKDLLRVNKLRILINTAKTYCEINNYNFQKYFPMIFIWILEVFDRKNVRYNYYAIDINIEALKSELDRVVGDSVSSKIIMNILIDATLAGCKLTIASNKFVTTSVSSYFLQKYLGKESITNTIEVTKNNTSSFISTIGRFLSTMDENIYLALLEHENFLVFPNRNFFTNKDENSKTYIIEVENYLTDVSNRSAFKRRITNLSENYMKEYLAVLLSNDINEERTFKFIEDSSYTSVLNLSFLSKLIPGIMLLSKSRDIIVLKNNNVLVDLNTAIDRLERFKGCFKFSNRYKEASSDLFDYVFSKFLENIYED